MGTQQCPATIVEAVSGISGVFVALDARLFGALAGAKKVAEAE